MNANTIYLPTLERIEIKNYSLYNQDLVYDFISGINLVIGGNGVGKTTFINIIKYSLIGLYKKDLVTRNYNGEKREIRTSYTNSNTFFRNRTQNLPSDKDSCVTLHFHINVTEFIVTRSLYDVQLSKVVVIENGYEKILEGKTIRQDAYDRLKNDNEREIYLQYQYELEVARHANLDSFNDFIFFINNILLFGETRNTILWDCEMQDRLTSNYFNDPSLERKRKEANSEKVYQNSIARHKSEEIKALNKVFQSIESSKNSGSNTTIKEIQQLNKNIDAENNLLEKLQTERNVIQQQLSNYYKKINDISNTINSKENTLAEIEEKTLEIVWKSLNPNYNVFKAQLLQNNICPMCNKPVKNDDSLAESNKCFLCHNELDNIDSENKEKLAELRQQIDYFYMNRQNIEREASALESDIKKLDLKYRQTKNSLFNHQNTLRNLEHKENNNDNNSETYLAMVNRINELTQDKDLALMRSKEYEDIANEFILRIESNLKAITKDISSIFSEFAEAFLQVPCILSYDSYTSDGVKNFIPVIDSFLRKDEEELSESQRFFIDYSFRMSILSYFYHTPSFYICETPDSSLDLSYEENAANVFLKYVERPNSLILTSNLNNSTFINNLINNAKNIHILNLLKYGKTSNIQKNHAELQQLASEIEVKVNEKPR